MMARRIEGCPKSTLREFNCKLSSACWASVLQVADAAGADASHISISICKIRLDRIRRPCPASARACSSSIKPSGPGAQTQAGLEFDPGSRQYAGPEPGADTELIRLEQTTSAVARPRGGLPAWQQKRVAGSSRSISRNFVRSSRARRSELYHFARLRQSFGAPPHHYHMGRRMDRRSLLQRPALGDGDRHADWLSPKRGSFRGIS